MANLHPRPAPRDLTPCRPGPLPRVQVVVELVGPVSVPGPAAARALEADWFHALGEPEVWAMSPIDDQWRRLVRGEVGPIDALSFGWDILGPRGRLNAQTTQVLLDRGRR